MEIPGSLTPTHTNCSPLGELKLALHESKVHGSWENDILRSIGQSAKEHFYETQAKYSDIKKQCDFLNKEFDLIKNQIKFLQDTRKKLKPEQHEEIAQCEIDLYVHQLEACSLHMALMVSKGTHIFKS